MKRWTSSPGTVAVLLTVIAETVPPLVPAEQSCARPMELAESEPQSPFQKAAAREQDPGPIGMVRVRHESLPKTRRAIRSRGGPSISRTSWITSGCAAPTWAA